MKQRSGWHCFGICGQTFGLRRQWVLDTGGGGASKSHSNAIPAHAQPKETELATQTISNRSTAFDGEVQLSIYAVWSMMGDAKNKSSLVILGWLFGGNSCIFRAGTNPHLIPLRLSSESSHQGKTLGPGPAFWALVCSGVGNEPRTLLHS